MMGGASCFQLRRDPGAAASFRKTTPQVVDKGHASRQSGASADCLQELVVNRRSAGIAEAAEGVPHCEARRAGDRGLTVNRVGAGVVVVGAIAAAKGVEGEKPRISIGSARPRGA